ncbi:MAG: hypothetical protein QOF42_2095 [Gammaproteobacteria bacterium]|nr:hypothetical protein [Gammaproteobacteria bacterium]
MRQNSLQAFGANSADPALEPAKTLDDRSAKFGNLSTASATATNSVDRYPVCKRLIEAIEDFPGVPVTHGH